MIMMHHCVSVSTATTAIMEGYLSINASESQPEYRCRDQRPHLAALLESIASSSEHSLVSFLLPTFGLLFEHLTDHEVVDVCIGRVGEMARYTCQRTDIEHPFLNAIIHTTITVQRAAFCFLLSQSLSLVLLQLKLKAIFPVSDGRCDRRRFWNPS